MDPLGIASEIFTKPVQGYNRIFSNLFRGITLIYCQNQRAFLRYAYAVIPIHIPSLGFRKSRRTPNPKRPMFHRNSCCRKEGIGSQHFAVAQLESRGIIKGAFFSILLPTMNRQSSQIFDRGFHPRPCWPYGPLKENEWFQSQPSYAPAGARPGTGGVR